jgi:hypothetical protein
VLRELKRALIGGRGQRIPEGGTTTWGGRSRGWLIERARGRRLARVSDETSALQRQVGSNSIDRDNHLLLLGRPSREIYGVVLVGAVTVITAVGLMY